MSMMFSSTAIGAAVGGVFGYARTDRYRDNFADAVVNTALGAGVGALTFRFGGAALKGARAAEAGQELAGAWRSVKTQGSEDLTNIILKRSKVGTNNTTMASNAPVTPASNIPEGTRPSQAARTAPPRPSSARDMRGTPEKRAAAVDKTKAGRVAPAPDLEDAVDGGDMPDISQATDYQERQANIKKEVEDMRKAQLDRDSEENFRKRFGYSKEADELWQDNLREKEKVARRKMEEAARRNKGTALTAEERALAAKGTEKRAKLRAAVDARDSKVSEPSTPDIFPVERTPQGAPPRPLFSRLDGDVFQAPTRNENLRRVPLTGDTMSAQHASVSPPLDMDADFEPTIVAPMDFGSALKNQRIPVVPNAKPIYKAPPVTRDPSVMAPVGITGTPPPAVKPIPAVQDPIGMHIPKTKLNPYRSGKKGMPTRMLASDFQDPLAYSMPTYLDASDFADPFRG